MPIPGTSTYTRPNFTTQSAAQYKANLDAMARAFERIAAAFAPHEIETGSPAPELAVVVDAGVILNGATLTEIAQQTVAGFTIPSAGQNRVDRVVIDATTGVATRVAGTAVTGSPTATPPAIPAGKLPCCQVLLQSSDTVVTNDMLTDERCAIPGAYLPLAGGTLTGALSGTTGTFTGAISGATAAGAMVATQAEQETGTATDKLVTSGRQKFHPSAAKAWVQCGVAGDTLASYNVSSVADVGAGVAGVNFTTAFSSANYAAVASDVSAVNIFTFTHIIADTNQKTASYCRMDNVNNVTPYNNIDPTYGYCFVAFGDQ